ncbi:hypothetical protein LSTR_LSTR008247 [Laodelphax striatellus]|uniref:Uncharacterized protein n=1 Tax=Laodelphax striatellus TaxID=195883 RepID=A0A482XLS8_LAOST|nr:hypothetical protein LSTR_LSTR008247 [Laodelphax striatellus]
MSLYFDYTVHVEDPVTSVNALAWHPQQALLAIACHSQDIGGSVTICDDLGEGLRDVQPAKQSCAAVGVAWHPARRMLVSAWANGELRVWNGERDFATVPTVHSAPLQHIAWSHLGGRFLSVDVNGTVIGWRVDSRGQLVSVFEHSLGVGVSCVEFARARPGPDLSRLARKAVAGDQRALDVFSAWRPRTAGQRSSSFGRHDHFACYLATQAGKVFHISESGSCQEALNCGNARVKRMLHPEHEESLIILTDGLSIGHYAVAQDGSLVEVNKVKMSAAGAEGSNAMVWAGVGVVACAVGATVVRCWDLSSGDSYSLPVQPSEQAASKQAITALAYFAQDGTLCACTNVGNILFWRRSMGGGGDGDDEWEQVAGSRVRGGHILSCSWGTGASLAVCTATTAFLLRQHALSAAYGQRLKSIFILFNDIQHYYHDYITAIQVSSDFLNDEIVNIYKNRKVYLFISVHNYYICSFACECECVALLEQSLVVLESKSSHVQVMTFQGTVKQSLTCSSTPIGLHLSASSSHLVVYTMSGVLHVWDLTRREAKAVCPPKDLMESLDDFGEVICARVNANGTRVSLSVAGVNLLPLPAVYVWDLENDSLSCHSFSADKSSDTKRFVVNHFWDEQEPRLLVCEAKRLPPEVSLKSHLTSDQSSLPTDADKHLTVLTSLAYSSSHGILVQDVMPAPEHFVSLLAVDTPYLIVLVKPPNQQRVTSSKILMKDFEGLENCDSATRAAVHNFSFCLSVGDIDQAFKTIRHVKSVAVWSTLAKLCVKTRRLDVAGVCLGRMGDARGVAALRQAQSYPQLEARLATLAVHLGLIEEAEKLFESCGRWDLLNKMLQGLDEWERALQLAEEKDRIHVRHTCHAYARYLEERGDTEAAADMYRRADTHRSHVTRMLLDQPLALESYVIKSKDPALYKWWAQYMESSGDMELAMKYYKDAGDHLSMVRVMCFLEEFDRAAEIASRSSDKAACYHLARQYENMGHVQEAVHFFTRATAYANAIRMCKEQHLDDQLWSLALSAGPREQTEAARHLESTAPDRAVLLYHRAGLFRTALDLAFRCEQFETVQLIATELDPDIDAELLVKCAQFFIEKEHFEKAVSLLAIARKYKDGVSLCWERSVPLTEELAEALTPSQGDPNRAEILEHLAECALMQANYHLATKKFTQAGNKVKAMKALLKSGDTEKVIFFATVSRQREIYVMAANYLQSLEWQSQPDLLKNIVTFYTKGRAPHLLANFYTSCAQVEIDEYGNYEKALGALNEAARCLSKDSDQYASVVESVARKTALVKKFLDIRRMLDRGEAESGLQQCRQLLSAGSDLVRSGDVYSLMIEQATKANDWRTAARLAQELRQAQPHDNLSLYIPKDIMERLGLNHKPEEENQEVDPEEAVEEAV